LCLAFTQSFEARHADWSAALCWSVGVTASGVFFASVLLHELGHSLTSRAVGLPVVAITLFLFGGVAQLSGEPSRPRDAFMIAVAGPAVSLFLGLCFLLAWLLLPADLLAGTVSSFCVQLGVLNLLIAGFNAVPGFPLDGGHVLRALLWGATGDFERATRIAAGVGAVFARLLIITGLALVFLAGWYAMGAWQVLIGWFLLRAARASTTQTVLRAALERLRVEDVMSAELVTTEGYTSVADALEGPLADAARSSVFVVEGGELIGVLGPAEIARQPPGRRPFVSLRSAMTPRSRMVGVSAREKVLDALLLMGELAVDELCVFADGAPVGEIRRGQVQAAAQARGGR
jgi:Zn-dependent protease/CBS domain-containing protein